MRSIALISLAITHAVRGDGPLWLTVKDHPHMCLDLYGGKTDNGTPIDIWTCDYNSKGQQWYFSPGTFKLRSVKDESKCIDASDMKQGTGLRIWDCNIQPQQMWSWSDKSSTIYLEATTKGTTMCADVRNAVYNDGSAVQAWTCDGYANQGWVIGKPVPPPKPFIMKVAVNTKFCLDLYGGAAKEGSVIDVWTCDAKTQGQQWYFVPGSYKLQSVVDPKMCIDAGDPAKGGSTFRSHLSLWACNGASQQTFGFDEKTGEIFLGKTKTAQSLCLTLTDFKDGAPLQLYTCNGGGTEKWSITDAAQLETSMASNWTNQIV